MIDYANGKEKTNQSINIGLAVTYDTTVDFDNPEATIGALKPKVDNMAKRLNKSFDFDLSIDRGIGGWCDDDIGVVGEPTFPMTISNYKSADDVKLFAYLMSDLAHQVQNATMIVEYSDKAEGEAILIPIKEINSDLKEVLSKAGLAGFTIYDDSKLLGVNFTECGIIEEDNVEKLVNALRERGLTDETRNIKTNKAKVEFPERLDRQTFYKTWLENRENSQNRVLSGFVKQALEINNYIDKNESDKSVRGLSSDKILERINKEKTSTIKQPKNVVQEINPIEKIKSVTNIKYNHSTSNELIKDHANLKNDKVYTLKQAGDIVEHTLSYILSCSKNNVRVRLPLGKKTIEHRTFQELNLAKDRDLAIENLVNRISEARITVDNGKNGEYTYTLFESNGYTEEIRKVITDIVKNSGDLSAKSKWVLKYYNTLRRYASYVHERAELTSQYVNAVTAQKVLEKTFKDTRGLNIGGETIVKELSIYKKMIMPSQGVQVFSKTGKNVSPSYITHLVNNFEGFTPENYGELYDDVLTPLVEELKSSFVNGKFPNREPTLHEMLIFNDIRARVLKRCSFLASEKHIENVKKAETAVLLSSVGTPAVSPKKYGKISEFVDSSINLPTYLREYLGEAHPVYKMVVGGYMKCSSNQVLASTALTNYVFDTILKKSGY